MNEAVKPIPSTYTTDSAQSTQCRGLILGLFGQQGQTSTEALANYEWFFNQHAFKQLALRVLTHHHGESSANVGAIALISRQWECEGRKLELGLLGNLVVDQQHRSLGPAVKLMRETLETVPQHLDFCYLLPNTKAEPLLKRIGAQRIGELSRFAKPLQTRLFLAQHAKMARFSFLAPLLDTVIGLEETGQRLFSGIRTRIEIDPVVDGRFDELWQNGEKSGWLMGERSAAYLRWRAVQYPKTPIRLLALWGNRGKKLQGYVAFCVDGQGNYQVDDFLSRDGLDGIKPLLLQFLRYVRQQNGRTVCVSFFGDERVENILTSLRLLKRESRPLYGVAGRLTWDELKDKRWYMTQLDEDQ